VKIVVAEWIWPNGLKLLAEHGCDLAYDPELWNKTELMREAEEADALIVRNQTRVDERLLRRARRLKVIGRFGVGLDNIDLAAAGERGIAVVSAGNANANAVAEYVIAAMFHACRELHEAAASVRRGEWDRKRFTRSELAGKTLGLIGFGETGRRTAEKAKALGMRVLCYDPYVPAEVPAALGVAAASREDVLRRSDFVSLHVPLTPATRRLIGAGALALMKRTAVLINTSRGAVVDEQALYEALAAERLAGAWLDVLEEEPPAPDHPLRRLPNCRITPHIAGLTEESQERTAEIVSRAVLDELAGIRSPYRVTNRTNGPTGPG
jgi:D-3-phosphoglycerate dehydrogenase/(S)-sulfolactate dehydrogenase